MNMKFPVEFPQYPVVRFSGKFLSLLICDFLDVTFAQQLHDVDSQELQTAYLLIFNLWQIVFERCFCIELFRVD